MIPHRLGPPWILRFVGTASNEEIISHRHAHLLGLEYSTVPLRWRKGGKRHACDMQGSASSSNGTDSKEVIINLESGIGVAA